MLCFRGGNGFTEACNAASEIAKHTAKVGAHMAECHDVLRSPDASVEQRAEATLSLSVRRSVIEMSGGQMLNEPADVAAGIVAERAALALVAKKSPGFGPFRCAHRTISPIRKRVNVHY